MYLLGILCLAAATAAQAVLPDPPTSPKSVAAAHQGSKLHTYIQNAATASAPLDDGQPNEKENEEVKKDMLKIASFVFPPPRRLQPFSYSILKKENADIKHIYKDPVRQEADNYKRENKSVIPEKSLQVELRPNTETLADFITALEYSKVCANILIVTSDSARVEDKKDSEPVRNNIVIPSMFSPTIPEPRLIDYAILKKQITGQKLISYDAMKEEANKSKKERKVILPVKKSDLLKVPPNPVTFLDSVSAPRDSEIRTIILNVSTDSHPVLDRNNDKEVRHMAEIATVVKPPPPELTPFDYSILKQQKADLNLKNDYYAKQAAEKYRQEKEMAILDLEKPVKFELPPNPPALPDCVAALPVSDVISDSDHEEAKLNKIKIATAVIPPPPELTSFDYSISRKQKADLNLKTEYHAKQAAEKYRQEKETTILDLEEPVKFELPPNPPALPDSVVAFPVSEVIRDSDNEEAKMNKIKIATVVIPPPPELTSFDYSILRKQKADLNLKTEYHAKQAAEKYRQEKETAILDLEEPVKFELPPNPPALPDSVAALPVSEVIRDSDNKEAKINKIKIATVVIPPPPELTSFDYSVLRKQKANLNMKTEYHAKQAAEKYNQEKKTVILDLGEPVKFEMPPNPPALPDSVAVLPVSKVIRDSDNEEGKMNKIKIATVVIPPPPELTSFDYSISRKQKADLNLKTEYHAKQAAEKYRQEKETVILDLGEPVKFELPPNPPALPDSVAALPVSKVIRDSDNEEGKMNKIKIATVVIPPPPELTSFDYSILRKQKADLNLKTEYHAKQAAEKYRQEKETTILVLEEPVKIEVPPNPPALPDSVVALPVSDVISDSDHEEAKLNKIKIATAVIPPPPELTSFDYSISRKQKADLNLKTEYHAKQAAEKYRQEKETAILDLEEPVKFELPPNPPALPDSVASLPVSEVIRDSDNEEAKLNKIKIATAVIPPPPELTSFDYSISRKQKADLNLKTEYHAKQAAEKYRQEKETAILDLEEPVKFELPPNPPALPDSVASLPVSEVIRGSDNEEVKMNKIKIATVVIPPPPELTSFDYSILRKQKANLNLKTEYHAKQAAKKYNQEKKTVILHLEEPVKFELPPNPPALPDSVAALPVSEVISKSDHEEAKMNKIKIATVVIPASPELTSFDYSILRKQKAELNLKTEYHAKQAAEKYRQEKETTILVLEEPVKIEVPPNPPALPDSVAALPVSEVIRDSDNEVAKMNKIKIATVVIPPPPELTSFDYSILRKQKADLNLKTEYHAKQAAEKYRQEKETAILDLEEPVKFELPPNPPALPDSVAALPVSEVIRDSDNEEAKMNKIKIATVVIPPPPELTSFDYSILRKQMTPNPETLIHSVIVPQDSNFRNTILNAIDLAPVAHKKNGEEVKHNMVKIASVVIPPPPELTPFDYSVLRKQNADLNLKTEYHAKQAVDKYKEETGTGILDLEKPVNVEMPPNWPFQRPSMSRSRFIYPKRDYDGIIYTN